jgi:hypothetical protein
MAVVHLVRQTPRNLATQGAELLPKRTFHKELGPFQQPMTLDTVSWIDLAPSDTTGQNLYGDFFVKLNLQVEVPLNS